MRDTVNQDLLVKTNVAYQQAIADNPDDAWAYCGLGATYRRLNRLPEGLAAIRRAIRIVPDFALAHRELAAIYDRMGLGREKRAALKRAKAIEEHARQIARDHLEKGGRWALNFRHDA